MQVTVRFYSVPPQFRGRKRWGVPPLLPFHQPHESTCGSTAIQSTPLPQGSIGLQTSMSSPEFELSPYGTHSPVGRLTQSFPSVQFFGTHFIDPLKG
ncbi:hypothetical protein TNCV_225761 [Trichonephila clavipes]|nr:hypothetical protein TNCV_225761 [Trichonephila clavipes]